MDILVSTSWLDHEIQAARPADDLVILDASAHLPGAQRDAAAEFTAGHIPGARFLDLPSLKDETSPVPSALPRRDQFDARMRSLGVEISSRIVLYDNSALRSAARAYFIFRMFGLDNVAILDGGLQKWLSENRPIHSGPADASPSVFAAPQEDQTRVRSKAQVLANLDSRAEQIVDARDGARFCGTTRDIVHDLPGGHIPGALNLHYADLLADDGTFLPQAEIERALLQAQVDLSAPVTATCGSGMTASVLLFAMELIGKHDTALYDGSWSEWGRDPDTPKQTGPSR